MITDFMASAKQIAWRKKFARMSKAGKFKKSKKSSGTPKKDGGNSEFNRVMKQKDMVQDDYKKLHKKLWALAGKGNKKASDQLKKLIKKEKSYKHISQVWLTANKSKMVYHN
jgi:hypothetical protein